MEGGFSLLLTDEGEKERKGSTNGLQRWETGFPPLLRLTLSLVRSFDLGESLKLMWTGF